MRFTWHNIHPLRQQCLVFMTSHVLFWWHHMQYIWHVIYCVWCHIHYMCDITQCLYLWHQNSMFVTYPLYMTSHTVLWLHNYCVTSQPLCLTFHSVYFWYYTQCTNFMKRSECMKSQPLYVWHHMHYIWHHNHSLWHHTTLFMTSSPLYLTSLPLYLCHHTHPIDDITATLCMTSHPVYLGHHIHYIYDIISTKYDITTLCVYGATLGIFMTSFALQMTTHPLYYTKPQYLWCHIHFMHDNAAPVSDIAPIVSMSLHRLHWHITNFCMTSHPPSVWHHMNYI